MNKKRSDKINLTAWDFDDPVEKVLKVIAILILVSLFGFTIYAFSIT